MMTLEEAIKHCEEKAEELEKRVNPYQCESINKKLYEVNKKEWDSCLECAKEHRQLAEWLKELKKYREILTRLDAMIDCYENCESCQGFREYPTSQFVKDVIQINKEVNADGDCN